MRSNSPLHGARSTMKQVYKAGLLVTLLFAVGCDIEDAGFMCNDEYVYGVRVDLHCPGLNGVEEWSGTVRLTALNYTEELNVFPTPEPDRLQAFGAGERPGTYMLTVESSKYKTWQQGGISVSENVCHVNQVTVTVELETN